MKQYPEWVKAQVRERIAAGETQKQLSKELGISRYSMVTKLLTSNVVSRVGALETPLFSAQSVPARYHGVLSILPMV